MTDYVVHFSLRSELKNNKIFKKIYVVDLQNNFHCVSSNQAIKQFEYFIKADQLPTLCTHMLCI